VTQRATVKSHPGQTCAAIQSSGSPRSKPVLRLGLTVTAVAGLIILVAAQASGAATPGESFVYDWTQTSGTSIGLMGTADFTLGPASTKSGFFDIASFSVDEPATLLLLIPASRGPPLLSAP
jgi:hypothetical protein